MGQHCPSPYFEYFIFSFIIYSTNDTTIQRFRWLNVYTNIDHHSDGLSKQICKDSILDHPCHQTSFFLDIKDHRKMRHVWHLLLRLSTLSVQVFLWSNWDSRGRRRDVVNERSSCCVLMSQSSIKDDATQNQSTSLMCMSKALGHERKQEE